MASHGRRGMAAVVLGSQTQKVLTHSTTPVLVYRKAVLMCASRGGHAPSAWPGARPASGAGCR